MAHVLSLLPQSRFRQSGVSIPHELNVTFLENTQPDSIVDAARTADALFMPPSHPYLSAELLTRLPALRIIQTAGAGFDCVDCRDATEQGIVVCNSPAQNAVTVAEYVLGAIISLQRELPQADQNIKQGNYVQIREAILSRGCLEIHGSTVGIVGLGVIGRTLARALHALGAAVIAADTFWPDTLARELGIRRVSLEELFAESDIVTLHCPLLPETRGLVGASLLASMKPHALLVNAARGGIVVEAELAEVLERGAIRGAAIDNFESEIPAQDNPLLNLSPEARRRVLFTPHLAGVTRAAFSRMLHQAIQNLHRVLIDGAPPNFSVNGIATIQKNA